jgi:replicative DNA helicase
MLSDLRESGAIEQDASVVVFIYRDEVYNASTQQRGIAELIVAKNRTGPTGVIECRFVKEWTRFQDFTPRDTEPQQEEMYG